jgi:hypothetical protein
MPCPGVMVVIRHTPRIAFERNQTIRAVAFTGDSGSG